MQEADTNTQVIPMRRGGIATLELPRSVAEHGPGARYAWEEYFAGKLRNPHTRQAYLFAVGRFLTWCEQRSVGLLGITPGMIGQYFDEHPASAPTKKLHMSAIRGLFDTLVLRHIVVLNPALSVKTERYSALEGKTPEITVEQARRLLQSIPADSVIGLRDRAIIGILVYTAARAGAVARLRLKDLVDEGTQLSLRFREKGGKHRVIPVRHDLQGFLTEYLSAATTDNQSEDGPLFRTALGRTRTLSDNSITGVDVCRLVKRRLKAAGLPTIISPHSFRSCTATDLLLQGVALEDVQHLLGHSDVRVTRLYDRRQRRVTRNIVERISV
jgi:site-specific recombinase XerD